MEVFTGLTIGWCIVLAATLAFGVYMIYLNAIRKANIMAHSRSGLHIHAVDLILFE
jgi:hypothetical protein